MRKKKIYRKKSKKWASKFAFGKGYFLDDLDKFVQGVWLILIDFYLFGDCTGMSCSVMLMASAYSKSVISL